MSVPKEAVVCAIFDMDGTLVDSMGWWHKVKTDFLPSHGIDPPPGVEETLELLELPALVKYFSRHFPLKMTPQEVKQSILDQMAKHYQEDVCPKSGAKEFIRQLRHKNIALCVATASEEHMATELLNRVGLLPYFDCLVTTERVGKSKDHPEVFLKAAELVGAQASECLVFEDTLFSACTAKDAGFRVVGLHEPHSQGSREEMEQICERVVDDFHTLLRELPVLL